MSVIGKEVLSTEKIKKGTKIVAKKLNDKYQDEDVLVITVVPGGVLFTADLVRELKFDIWMDYISCPHTPGDRNNLSPIVYHETIPTKGKHVILIDDAIESGSTMKRIVEFIKQEHDAKSVSIATLFVKPGRAAIAVDQYFAYEMEDDDLLVGYGLSWNGKYRNIPFVSKLAQ
ncbi:phosphoribosyltransferase [Agaribacterium sp. ZY112]|uniref:phosphoribosyltransferase n=1 Tax=Agaribacterium sp. ZY112 TaxID=3233574 RepID=UPI003526282B